ncbi:Hypothetical predicted protein, partial [Olea europaea subsp. europaea]
MENKREDRDQVLILSQDMLEVLTLDIMIEDHSVVGTEQAAGKQRLVNALMKFAVYSVCPESGASQLGRVVCGVNLEQEE